MFSLSLWGALGLESFSSLVDYVVNCLIVLKDEWVFILVFGIFFQNLLDYLRITTLQIFLLQRVECDLFYDV